MASAKIKPNDKKFSTMKKDEIVKYALEKGKRGHKARVECLKRGINLEAETSAE